MKTVPQAFPSIDGPGKGLIARIGHWTESNFRWFLALYLAFLLVAAVFSEGWNQADEHARVLEPAHKIVYGYATLPWEFDANLPMVSHLLGAIHSVPLYAGQAFQASGMTEAALLRVWSALFNSTRVIPFFLMLGLLGFCGTTRGVMTLLYCFAPISPVLMVRTGQENWSSTALVWGVWLLMFALKKTEKSATKHLVGAGIFLGLAASFRFQTGVAVASIWVWKAFQKNRRDLIPLTSGIFLGLLPLIIADWMTVGVPLLPAWNYLAYALSNEEGGHVWGTDPWHFYLEGFFTAFHPPVSLILAPMLLIGCRLWPLGGAIIVPFALVHTVLGHKELRYFFPIFPFLYMTCYVGFARVGHRWLAIPWLKAVSKILPPYALATAVIAIALALVPLHPAPRMYQALNDFQNAGKFPSGFTYVANSRSNVALFYFKHPDKLPPRIDVEDFLNLVRSHKQSAGAYAIYRMDILDYQIVTSKCQVLFESLSPIHQRVLLWAQNVLRKKDIDAVVQCPAGGVS